MRFSLAALSCCTPKSVAAAFDAGAYAVNGCCLASAARVAHGCVLHTIDECFTSYMVTNRHTCIHIHLHNRACSMLCSSFPMHVLPVVTLLLLLVAVACIGHFLTLSRRTMSQRMQCPTLSVKAEKAVAMCPDQVLIDVRAKKKSSR